MRSKRVRKSPDPQTPLEEILIGCYKDKMAAYLNEHSEAFAEAMNLALSDNQPYAWRSAWVISLSMQPNDLRLRKYINKILAFLPHARDNQKRGLIKILHSMELTQRQEVVLFDYSIKLWQDISKQGTVRVTAFSFLLKISKKYPELEPEVIMLANERLLKPLSRGIRHSIELLLKKAEFSDL